MLITFRGDNALVLDYLVQLVVFMKAELRDVMIEIIIASPLNGELVQLYD